MKLIVMVLSLCAIAPVFAQSGYNTPNPNQPIYQIPAGPDSLNDIGPGSGAAPVIQNVTNDYKPAVALPAPSVPVKPAPKPSRTMAAYDSSAYIGTNSSGGLHVNGPNYSYSVSPNNTGGYYVSSSNGSYYVSPNGFGGYNVSGPHGLSYMSPNSAGGYNISGPDGAWTIVSNGAGGYKVSGPEGAASITPDGAGGYNVSGPVNPAYVAPVLSKATH